MYNALLFDLDLWTLWIHALPILQWMLQPIDTIWQSADWPTRVHLWIGTPLILRLMEGGWWTFFKWLDLLWVSPSLLLDNILNYIWHQSLVRGKIRPIRDVRFWFPVSIQVQLYYGGLPFRPTTWYKKRMMCKSRRMDDRRGIRLRMRVKWVQVRFARALALPRRICQYMWSLVRKRLATFHESGHTRDHWRSTRDYDAILFDCRGRFMSTQDKMDLQAIREIYGYDPDMSPVDDLLNKMHPLDLFRNEMDARTKLFGFRSDAISMEEAFVAAVNLERELKMTTKTAPDPNMSGGYITERHEQCDMPIVFDTGASFSVTPVQSDFISGLTEAEAKHMNGLTDSALIEGKGWVEWTVKDVFGRIHVMRTMAFYVPAASIRLFSPQLYFQANHAGRCTFDEHSVMLTTANGEELQFPYHPGSNLPYMYLAPGVVQAGLSEADLAFLYESQNAEAFTKMFEDNNYNLSKPQKELLTWHSRLGHAGFRWIQDLMRVQKPQVVGELAQPPLIPTKITGTANCAHPLCPACQFAKQHRRTPDSQTTHNVPEHEMAIRRNDLYPGDCVSVDQYVCKRSGRIRYGYGKNKSNYNGGTIFVDHASGYMSVHHQFSLSELVKHCNLNKMESASRDTELTIIFSVSRLPR